MRDADECPCEALGISSVYKVLLCSSDIPSCHHLQGLVIVVAFTSGRTVGVEEGGPGAPCTNHPSPPHPDGGSSCDVKSSVASSATSFLRRNFQASCAASSPAPPASPENSILSLQSYINRNIQLDARSFFSLIFFPALTKEVRLSPRRCSSLFLCLALFCPPQDSSLHTSLSLRPSIQKVTWVNFANIIGLRP